MIRPWPFLQYSSKHAKQAFPIEYFARKLEREQKKWKFAQVQTFSTNSSGNACYAGYLQVRSSSWSIRLFCFQIPLHLYWFVRMNRCLIRDRLTLCSAGPSQKLQFRNSTQSPVPFHSKRHLNLRIECLKYLQSKQVKRSRR